MIGPINRVRPIGPAEELAALERVDAFLSGESRWRRRMLGEGPSGAMTPARLLQGDPCDGGCVGGADLHVNVSRGLPSARYAILRAVLERGFRSIPDWNDASTFAGVKALLASLIEEKREQVEKLGAQGVV